MNKPSKLRAILAVLALIGATVAAVLFSPGYANAAGNSRCDTGDAKDGAYLCAITNVVNVNGLRVRRLELWVGGNRATLEGGGCGESGPSAVKIDEVSILNNAETSYLWGPRSSNLCQSQGYSRTWTMDIPIKCNGAKVYVNYVLHDNGGTDKRGVLFMDAETC